MESTGDGRPTGWPLDVDVPLSVAPQPGADPDRGRVRAAETQGIRAGK